MRKFALLGLILLASTASASQWKLINNGSAISDGKLTISHLNGHYKIKYSGDVNPRSASLLIDGDVIYGNEPYGFSGIYGDGVVKRLLLASEATANYDDRFRTKPSHEKIELESLRATIEKLK
ncbi:MAG: hypothetical protein E6093_04340 [Serratia liquefaciens]|nr:hypothetical protein [Serratia liquefaciens]